MVTLRATAIMKTDISSFTARFRSLPEQHLTHTSRPIRCCPPSA